MKTRLVSAALIAVSLFASGAAMAAPPQGQKTVQAMFAFADRDHDGQLTRAEAKGRLPLTYDNFDRIDTAKRGWISLEQFAEFTNQRAASQAEAVLKVGASH